MANRYCSRPRSNDDYDYDPTHGATITVWNHDPHWTGLLDANGDEIWRDPRTIGFHHPLND